MLFCSYNGKRLKLYFYLLVTLFCLSVNTFVRADDLPQLNSQAYLLYPNELAGYDESNYTLQFDSILSRQGRFVVGLTTLYELAEFKSSLNLWKTDQFEMKSHLDQRLPDMSYDLGVSQQRPNIALSPDEQYAAVLIDNTMIILNLPDLDIYPVKLPIQLAINSVAWSPNAKFIAMLTDNQLFVYNIKSREYFTQLLLLNHQSSDYPPTMIRSMGNGWLYDDYSNQVLVYCMWRLEACQTYQLEQQSRVAAASDNSQLITYSLETQMSQKWTHTGGTDYQVSDLGITGFYRAVFSPKGHYLAGYQYLSRDKGFHTVIYEFDAMRQVFVNDPDTVNQALLPTWFPNEVFFLTLNRNLLVKLYQTENDTPLQMLDLNSIDIEAVLNEPIKFRTSKNLSIQLDEKGDKALITFDYSAMLLPILHE